MIHTICSPVMGLGNRLKNIASTIRIRDKDEPITIHWDIAGHLMQVPLSSLFTIEGVEYSETSSLKVPRNERCVKTWRLLLHPGEVPPHFSVSTNMYSYECDGAVIDNEYNRIPQHVVDAYKPIFESFKPNSTSVAIAEQIGSPEYAVHVRTNPVDWPGARELHIQRYIDTIHSLPDRVYVCCHTPEVQAIVEGAVPNGKIYSIPNKQFTNLQIAVAEMLILGRAKHLFTTLGSTFSEAGWWLGGCQGLVIQLGQGELKWDAN